MYYFNRFQGFIVAIIWVEISMIKMGVIGWRKYYLYKNRRDKYYIVNDVEQNKIKETAIVFSIILSLILLIESWQPIISPMIGHLPKMATDILGITIILFVCVLHQIILRFVVYCVMSYRLGLLEKRERAIARDIRRRKELIEKLEKCEE